jgi:hypothetical protein
VVVPDSEPVERRLVVIRDITPPERVPEHVPAGAEELANEPVEVLPSVEPSS